MKTGTLVGALALFALLPLVADAQSLEGAWRLAEYSSSEGPTYKDPEGLMLFVGGHYSRTYVRANDARPVLTDASSDADRVAAWSPFVSNAGTYKLDGSTLTLQAGVAKMPAANRLRQPVTYQVRIEGDTLYLTGDAEGVTGTKQRWIRVRP